MATVFVGADALSHHTFNQVWVDGYGWCACLSAPYQPLQQQGAINIWDGGYPAANPYPNVSLLEQQVVQTQRPKKSLKRKHFNKQRDTTNLPYVKKPLNAFMLFRKEQWPLAAAQQNTTNSKNISLLLGQKWRSLPKEQQAKYFLEAERQKLLHSLEHPGWSCKDNYGRHKARRRTPRSSASEASDAGQARPAVRQVISVKVSDPQTPAEQKDASSPDLHPEDPSSQPSGTGLGQPDSVLLPSDTGVIWPDFSDSILPPLETGVIWPGFSDSVLPPSDTGLGQPDSVLPPLEPGVIWPDFSDSVLPPSDTGLGQPDSVLPPLEPGVIWPDFSDSVLPPSDTGLGQPDSVLPPLETGVIWPDFSDSVLPPLEPGVIWPDFSDSVLDYHLQKSSLLDFKTNLKNELK